MKKEQILLKVRSSRKSYFFYYFLIILIMAIVYYLYYVLETIDYKKALIGIVFVILIIKFIEVHRLRDWWAITDSCLIESKSIFNKNVRELSFNSIVDIDLSQEWYKRILGYGNISIRKLLNERSILVKNINNPERFINILQGIIQGAKIK